MKASKFLSIILHPIFIPIATIYISILKLPNTLILQSQIGSVLIILSLFTVLLPLINVSFFILIGKVKNINLNHLEERVLVLISTIAWLVIGYIILKDLLFYSPVLKKIYLGTICIQIISCIISVKWKISLHMLAMGGAIGTFISLNFIYGGMLKVVIYGVLASGFLGYARLEELAHDKAQVYSGFTLGFFIITVSILYL